MLAGWMLLHPFWGITHDSILYSFQALARLHPDTLGHDIFLRFGSQDQYTLFSPLYAAAIRTFGLEPAGAILTLLAHLLFFSSAWLLARRFVSTELALLAVGLLIVLPSGYGAYYIFNYTEDFLTPREPAEAFVLAGLAAAVANRYVWSLVAIAAAMALHPIMGFAGLLMLLTLRVAIPRPRLAIGVTCLGLVALACVAYLSPTGPLARMDDTWLHIVRQRSRFLFILDWSADDWARTLLPYGVLAVGLASTTRSVRVFCLAALTTALLGVTLSLVAGDLLHIVVVLQAQAWRWQWVANVIAVLLMPAVCRELWAANPLGRSAVLLLIAAWISRGQSVVACSFLVGSAFACAIASRRNVRFAHERFVLKGAGAAIFVFLVATVASKLQLLAVNPIVFDDPGPLVLQLTREWATDGIIPAAILIAVWLAGRRWNNRLAGGTLLAAASIACALLLPSAWSAWTQQSYPRQEYEAFAPLRATIPSDAEVLWPDAPPIEAWYLLERQSYVSGAQTAGLVFSRAAALAMYRRVGLVSALVRGQQFDDWTPKTPSHLTPEQKLRSACTAPDLEYVMSWTNLGPPALASYLPNSHHPKVRARLYRCSDVRSEP